MDDSPKRAAVDPEELGQKRLSEISAAEFLQLLEQAAAPVEGGSPEDATVGDVLVGVRAAHRMPVGGLPEKKKLEREKWPLEKFAPEKLYEQFPEKKKVELEKLQIENFPEKKKVELEKQQVELPPDILSALTTLGDRLAAIEKQLSKPSG